MIKICMLDVSLKITDLNYNHTAQVHGKFCMWLRHLKLLFEAMVDTPM